MNTRKIGLIAILSVWASTINAQFAPPAGIDGSTAIHKDSTAIVNWASAVTFFEVGPQDISDSDSEPAGFGTTDEALGEAEGNSANVLSLGDGGQIVLTFPYPIKNEEGHDFAVFENTFSETFLELAHVEVSSDGETFFRFPSISNTQTDEQIDGFGEIDATHIYNLAGKYIQGFGTPFDLEELTGIEGLDVNSVTHVKIIDVVGSVDAEFGSVDSEGELINDPFPTAFASSGFDLDAVGVIHEDNPFANLTEERRTLSVFPNPSYGNVTIESSEKIMKISLISINGKNVFTGQIEELNEFLSRIENGMYILHLTYESKETEQIQLVLAAN